ncbi:TetR/AcrR family transcriptional regulator [Pseudooceanicola sp. CBS1P-1]|uniref:TetR family transcriptional regulator n=1 Tax=Pseudooceanicola albus TaxID=2692189 RepID=A0A6L7G8M1_9RHOB|nr:MULTISPECIES: TetR/AcrR family transcriptional regulator [Pseudooceanicola]MBT9386551.1 TetR/AcrR family transcriptional regulator [Pseudooceanicola endophyticus]MXN20584.1 TetR family transcriptional regulator [Pseudooceanicola albus]
MIKRRTQDERSTETRRLLQEATVRSLMEVGYANTSTSEIARRAGVSRGAQTHHYPGKMDLIVAATEYMFRNFADQLEALGSDLRAGRLDYDSFFDALWEEMQHGDWFYSSLEIIVAARGDEELRQHLEPLIMVLHARFEATWLRSFEATDPEGLGPRPVMNLVMNVFRGMAVQAVLRPEPRYFEEIMHVLKTMIAAHLRPRTRAATPVPAPPRP